MKQEKIILIVLVSLLSIIGMLVAAFSTWDFLRMTLQSNLSLLFHFEDPTFGYSLLSLVGNIVGAIVFVFAGIQVLRDKLDVSVMLVGFIYLVITFINSVYISYIFDFSVNWIWNIFYIVYTIPFVLIMLYKDLNKWVVVGLQSVAILYVLHLTVRFFMNMIGHQSFYVVITYGAFMIDFMMVLLFLSFGVKYYFYHFGKGDDQYTNQ